MHVSVVRRIDCVDPYYDFHHGLLAELKDALGTPASLATIWRAVAALDVTVKKNGPALRTRST